MAMKYHVHPNSLRIFLYYPVRLIGLLQQNGRLGWHLFRHDAQVHARPEGQNEADALKYWLFLR